MTLDLNKVIVPDENKSEFHTNMFAKAANGNRVGSTSELTFEQLRQRDMKRKIIGSYQSSSIGNAYSALRAKPVAPDRGAISPVPPRPPRNF